jgi:OmcA/MtrC family decaheme c-type cytochrome
MNMGSGNVEKFIRGCACAILAAALLAGCSSGKDGATGATGTTGGQGPAGSPGPTGPILALDISTATSITATITSVSSGASPVVKFALVDQVGNPLSGLQATDIRLGIAQLQPAAAGASNQWVSYITTVAKPAAGVGWGNTQVQATTETASAANGVFTDNGDGTYSYTFSKSLDDFATATNASYASNPPPGGVVPAIAQAGGKADLTLTHRIGLELRGTTTTLNPTNNAVYDYVPATGATTGLATRAIASNQECDACHAKFAIHGGPRIDVEYCVICHNSGTTDPESNNSLDLKVLAHKIHSGVKLPSVVADTANHGTVPAPGIGYVIFGYGGSVNNFNTVVWPQDTRNCTTCHNTGDANTPDAANYQNYVFAGACATCHDDFPKAGVHPGGVTDADCASSSCHSPTSTTLSPVTGVPISVTGAHLIPQLELAKQFQFTVLRVEAVQDAAGTVPGATACAATAAFCTVLPGEYPKVTIKITNPQDGSVYKLTDAPFTNTYVASGSTTTTTARVRGRVAYTTLNYTNPGANTGTSATQAGLIDFMASTTTVLNADGSYTAVAARPLPPANTPALSGGSGAVTVEGRAIMNLAAAGQPVANGNVPIRGAEPLYFAITDATPVARRDVVDTANCLRCHKSLQLHGDSRSNNVKLCITCHNPAQAPRVTYKDANGVTQPGGSEPVDFKFLIHSLHAANYKFGRLDYTEVGFPGQLNNCLGCHQTDTYYPVDPAKVFATSIDAGTAYDDPTQHIAITANAAACGACHVTAAAALHMHQNGAVVITDQLVGGLQFGAPNVPTATMQQIKAADGSTQPQFRTETCTVCHGPGATADVKVVHQVTSFKYN